MRRYGLVFAVVGSTVLLSSSRAPFTVRDKAYFADPAVVAFVRPGLVLKILSAQIQSDQTIQARFRITDPAGLPLDRTGVTTPGAVSTSFIAAVLPNDADEYTAYTTRIETAPAGFAMPAGTTAVQAAVDTGGTYSQVGDGEYIYTFATKVPQNYDPTATHAVGVYASRDLTEFDLGTNYANDVFRWVPSGAPVTRIELEVTTASCNKCHDPLQAHGGARREVALCILCHTPQTTDAETGNTVDFKVMIHKIHMGEDLPSVQAGHPYQIVGFRNAVNDFSTVAFPAVSPANCQMCHDGSAPDADAWLTDPSRAACGACHDDVNFATGEGHANLPQLDDQLCSTCHVPVGANEFDVSITGAHTLPQFSSQLRGVTFTLNGVQNTAPGQNPTVTFTVKDRAGNPIDASTMNLLNLTMAGPTYSYGIAFTEDARKAPGSNGVYTYTMRNAVPADANGSWGIGIEGYINTTINVLNGTQVVRDVGTNKVTYFSVTGGQPTPSRAVVVQENCNQCHFALSAHGTIRNRVEYCVMCHNANNTDVSQRPADQLPPQTIAFRVLIHRIHTGENQESPYIVYGFGGRPVSFDDVRFPGDRRHCAKCHINNSQQLPVPANERPIVNPRGFIDPEPPATAACLGCHTSQAVAAHAQQNITSLGESCVVCHGPNADFSVDRVHAR